jgi:uncharacterized cofD-like protein
VARLLGAKGRVLPMALTPMDIQADVRGLAANPDQLTTVRGQVEIATTDGVISSIRLGPDDPPVSPAAMAAIRNADWVVLGPGSWFTSVIPHLMVPALRDALVATEANLVVVLNLEEQAGETPGFGPADHLAVLVEHAPALTIHTVLADGQRVGAAIDELRDIVAAHGARLEVGDLAADDGSPRHDPAKLAAAYSAIFDEGD